MDIGDGSGGFIEMRLRRDNLLLRRLLLVVVVVIMVVVVVVVPVVLVAAPLRHAVGRSIVVARWDEFIRGVSVVVRLRRQFILARRLGAR